MLSSFPLSEYARRSVQRASLALLGGMRRQTTRLRVVAAATADTLAARGSKLRLASAQLTALNRRLGRLPPACTQHLAVLSQLLRPAPFTPAVTAVRPPSSSPLSTAHSADPPATPAFLARMLRSMVHMVQVTTRSSSSLSSNSATTATTTTTIAYAHHVAAQYRAPRHPVLLCHGLFGYDKMGPETFPQMQIHYWRGIKDALCQLGADVYVARVAAAGSIRQRATQLHSALRRAMGNQTINIVAHSMGGLDARYLVSNVRPNEYRVASVTTVSTPHRGSPFMDWCRDNLSVGAVDHATATAYPATARASSSSAPMAQKHRTASASTAYHTLAPPLTSLAQQLRPALQSVGPWLDHPAYGNLTTGYLRDTFNPDTPDQPGVRYFSFGARAPPLSVCHVLRMPWEVIDAQEGENDGLVSVSSARWGEYLGTVDADHWELNNRWRWFTPKRASFDVQDFYMSIATRLYQEGL